MKDIIKFILVLITVLFVPHSAMAADELFIPLGTTGKPARIITVSHSGGDFTDPVAAVASITDASADNPYLVLIGPGVYRVTKTLAMQPFVSIAGAGQETTVLTGAIGSEVFGATSALVSGADNATLSDLAITNSGGSSVSIAMYNGYSSPVIHAVTATAYGGTYNYGVYNYSSAAVMIDVTAAASKGFLNAGVVNHYNSTVIMTGGAAVASEGRDNQGVSTSYSSTAIMTGVTAKAVGGFRNFAVHIENASVNMTGGTATGSGGTINYGVFCSSSDYYSSPVLTDVMVEAAGGRGYGLYGNIFCLPVARQSTFHGDTLGIYVEYGGTARIMQSSISGGVVLADNRTITCVHSDDGQAAALDSDCLPISP